MKNGIFKKLKSVLCIVLATVLIGTTTACGSNNASSQQGKGTASSGDKKVVNIALSENLNTLDPLDSDNLPMDSLSKMIYDTLVESDQKGNYTPGAAESWTTSSDGLTWTFKLRKGIKYTNGEDLNADCVVTTMERLIKEPELAIANTYWGSLGGVKKVDDYTVQITMKEKFAPMLLALSFTPIIPAKAWAQDGKKMYTEQKCIGTGPWKFVQWVDGQYVHLVKNPDFWGKDKFNSYYDEVYLRMTSEISTAISAQLSGEVQAYINSDGIPANMLTRYKGTENKINLTTIDSSTFYYMGFSMKESSPFYDKKVREAFEFAIDRQQLADKVLFGKGTVPNSIICNPVVGYNPDLPKYEYNPTKAKQLLSESSYKGKKIVLYSHTNTLKAQDMLVAISAMLNSVGFNTSVQVVEPATLRDLRATGNYDCFMVTNYCQGGDPFPVLNYRILNDGHHSMYKNPEMMSIIKQSNQELDPKKREQLLQKFSALMREESAPQTALVQLKLTEAVNYGLTGVEIYQNGFFSFRYVSFDKSKAKA